MMINDNVINDNVINDNVINDDVINTHRDHCPCQSRPRHHPGRLFDSGRAIPPPRPAG